MLKKRQIRPAPIFIFFFNDTATTEIYTLSLHDALPISSYVNFTAVLAMMKVAASSNTDIAVICAGEEGGFTLEDAACAGRYVRALPKRSDSMHLNDAASASVLIEKKYGENIAKLFKESSHGQALQAAGFGDDLAAAAEVDAYPVVPIYQERQITKLGPERAR